MTKYFGGDWGSKMIKITKIKGNSPVKARTLKQMKKDKSKEAI